MCIVQQLLSGATDNARWDIHRRYNKIKNPQEQGIKVVNTSGTREIRMSDRTLKCK